MRVQTAVHTRSSDVQRKEDFFWNGEELDEFKDNYDEEERKSWEVIIILPGHEVIPSWTFYEFINLKTVIMADTVKRIEDCAFRCSTFKKFGIYRRGCIQ